MNNLLCLSIYSSVNYSNIIQLISANYYHFISLHLNWIGQHSIAVADILFTSTLSCTCHDTTRILPAPLVELRWNMVYIVWCQSSWNLSNNPLSSLYAVDWELLNLGASIEYAVWTEYWIWSWSVVRLFWHVSYYNYSSV